LHCDSSFDDNRQVGEEGKACVSGYVGELNGIVTIDVIGWLS
jgi:hypothetical protein